MSTSRRQFIAAGLFAPALLNYGCLAAAPVPKPNFTFLLCGDLGYADVGCFGAKGFKTPNLDRVGAQGMKFANLYVGAPVCSVSRAALMTGCTHTGLVSGACTLLPSEVSRMQLV